MTLTSPMVRVETAVGVVTRRLALNNGESRHSHLASIE